MDFLPGDLYDASARADRRLPDAPVVALGAVGDSKFFFMITIICYIIRSNNVYLKHD